MQEGAATVYSVRDDKVLVRLAQRITHSKHSADVQGEIL
jgi:hypothetical protein